LKARRADIKNADQDWTMPLLRTLIITALFITTTRLTAQVAIRDEGTHFRHQESVKVTFDPHVVLTRKILMQVASSPAVEHQAIRDVNGKALESRLLDEKHLLLDDERPTVTATFALDDEQQLILAEGTAFGTLYAFLTRVEAPPEQPRKRSSEAECQALVRRYHEAVRKRFEEALDTIAKREFAKHVDRQAGLAEVDQSLAHAAQDGVAAKRAQLRKVSAGLPQAVLEDSVSNLMKQKQSLELDELGLDVRAAQFREQAKAASDLLKKARPDEEILADLNRVRQSRVQTLERLRALHKQGVITGAEIAKAEEEVAIAQMEINQATRDATKAPSDRVEKLNAELASITVALMEARQKKQYIGHQLAELQESLNREISEAKPLREEIAAQSALAQEFAADARKREAELLRLKASYRPARVEVFDLKAIEEKPIDAEKTGPR
jgi:hypothetical protein